MTSAIELLRVSKNYGKTRVLDDVSFDCPEGSIIAFVGPNGAGKSTSLRIICRLSSATEGEVRLGGVDVSDIRDEYSEHWGPPVLGLGASD